MQRPHDERAKLIAERALDLLGEIQREKEVPTADAQRMDLWFQRQRHLASVPGYLALLDVLFPFDCIIEAFCQALGLEDFWESHRKQYSWRHYLQEQARPPSAPEAAGERVCGAAVFVAAVGRKAAESVRGVQGDAAGGVARWGL